MLLRPPSPRRINPFFTLIAWQQQMRLAAALAKAQDQMLKNLANHTTIAIRCPQQIYGCILCGSSPLKAMQAAPCLRRSLPQQLRQTTKAIMLEADGVPTRT